MVKTIFSTLLLAVALIVVPQSYASTKCVHFTNFCDSLQLTTSNSASGVLAFGGWDWLCTGDYTDAQVMGIARSGHAILSSRPESSGYFSPYTFTFDFDLANHLFDLYETDGTGVLQLQTNQPWTGTSGNCRDERNANSKSTASGIGKR